MSPAWSRATPRLAPNREMCPRPCGARLTATEDVPSIRVRWIGHNLHAKALILARSDVSLAEAHHIGEEAGQPCSTSFPSWRADRPRRSLAR